MSKILILGANGVLGQSLKSIFTGSSRYSTITWDKENLDITNKQAVLRQIQAIQPDVVINAAAYTDVDAAEKNQELAMKVNGEAVGFLAEASRCLGALFVHISTDYVFGQESKQGYKEDDIPQKPLNVYGKSKLLGEKLLLREEPKGLKYYLIRTSWLFGKAQLLQKHNSPIKKNFVDAMLALAKTRKELSIVDDQHGKATYAEDLANTIQRLVEQNAQPGIYHFTNEPALTWYSFAKEIFAVQKQLNPHFNVPKIFPVSSKEFPRPAKRPHFSVLLNTKLPKGRNIKEALQGYLTNHLKEGG